MAYDSRQSSLELYFLHLISHIVYWSRFHSRVACRRATTGKSAWKQNKHFLEQQSKGCFNNASHTECASHFSGEATVEKFQKTFLIFLSLKVFLFCIGYCKKRSGCLGHYYFICLTAVPNTQIQARTPFYKMPCKNTFKDILYFTSYDQKYRPHCYLSNKCSTLKYHMM